MIDFIQGERFMDLANDVNIFYRHTHEVNDFFKNVPVTTPFVLISHNSDGAVKEGIWREEDANSNLMPPNLIHWFGQNIDVVHPKISALPIGLENSKWFVSTKKIEKIKNIGNTPKSIRNLVYLNVNVANNKEVRQPIYNILQNKKYVTIEYGKNGISFDMYLDNLYHHCFMICPEGHGIDVHQPWESLYANTIPIQKKNINNSGWRDLPICWLDNWKQLEDEEFLAKEYIRIKTQEWNMSKLTFTYWKDIILNI